jgi:hypothetical protein
MPSLPTMPEKRPSPSLLLYGLAFRVLRRIALPGHAADRAVFTRAARAHQRRCALRPADRVVLERAPGAAGPDARCSLCLPDDVQ